MSIANDPRSLRCDDCEEAIPKGQRRTRCRYCGKLVCAWCLHHVHNFERTVAAPPTMPAPGKEPDHVE